MRASGGGAGDPEAPAALSIIAVRYSILWRNRRRWNLGRERDFDDYRAALFDDSRLALRLFLWRNISLHSLAEQRPALDPAFHRVLIFTSADLPQPHREALDASILNLPWACIVAVDPDEERLPLDAEIERFMAERGAGPDAYYASIRLDDDDALARDFVARTSRYAVPSNLGSVVSQRAGYLGRLSPTSGRFERFARTDMPKSSAGLTLIGGYSREQAAFLPGPTNVFFANHTQIDREAPIIYGRGSPAFLKSVYPEQDTAARRWRRLEFLRRAPRREIDAAFGLSPLV
jgi:Putative rhamnosyl transferase